MKCAWNEGSSDSRKCRKDSWEGFRPQKKGGCVLKLRQRCKQIHFSCLPPVFSPIWSPAFSDLCYLLWPLSVMEAEGKHVLPRRHVKPFSSYVTGKRDALAGECYLHSSTCMSSQMSTIGYSVSVIDRWNKNVCPSPTEKTATLALLALRYGDRGIIAI